MMCDHYIDNLKEKKKKKTNIKRGLKKKQENDVNNVQTLYIILYIRDVSIGNYFSSILYVKK
jgi:hypothetical protein